MLRLSVILAAALALQSGTSVLLNWQAPPKSDDPVTGYNVYRTDGGSHPFLKINKELLRLPTYKDTTVQVGHSYSYYIRSVDAKGTESPPSNSWTVTVPKKSKQKVIEAKQTPQ
jgi:fibronectin type 3 domain-containing protein